MKTCENDNITTRGTTACLNWPAARFLYILFIYYALLVRINIHSTFAFRIANAGYILNILVAIVSLSICQ